MTLYTIEESVFAKLSKTHMVYVCSKAEAQALTREELRMVAQLAITQYARRSAGLKDKPDGG